MKRPKNYLRDEQGNGISAWDLLDTLIENLEKRVKFSRRNEEGIVSWDETFFKAEFKFINKEWNEDTKWDALKDICWKISRLLCNDDNDWTSLLGATEEEIKAEGEFLKNFE